MRIVSLAIAGSLLGTLLATTVAAEEASVADLRQPALLQQTAFEYDNYRYFAQKDGAAESPGDAPPPAADKPPEATGCGEPSCGESGDPCGRCQRCCGLGDPWTLPQPYFLASRGFTVGGWVSAGVFANAWGDASNGPLGLNNVGDGFTMNQLWIYTERVADTRGYGFDWGFRFDYVFGVDGPDTQAFGDEGWDFGWNSSRDYGSAIPQLYVELAYNDLSIKLGHFYTIIGYESIPAPDNFFYTHSYTHNYGEPFTHTGFLADYALNDRVTLYGGWAAGWDSGWEDLNEGSIFLGGVGLELSDRATLTWALTAGDFGAGKIGRISGGALAAGNIYMNSIVFQYEVTDRFTYVLQHDLGDNSNLGAADNEWYGVNQYFLYQFNESLAAGLRFEWFRDDDGTRVIAGNAGNYYEATLGLNWKPHANLTVRPEIRYDWYNGVVATAPFNEGRNNEQFSGGLDLIFTY